MTNTERKALCKRIDELCAEVERLKADSIHWELGNCPSCPNVADLQEALDRNTELQERIDAAHMSRLLTENENESLRELVRDLYEMAYPEYPSAFEVAFADRMRELGIEVTA